MLEHCPPGVIHRKPPTNDERAKRWRGLFNQFRPREPRPVNFPPRSKL